MTAARPLASTAQVIATLSDWATAVEMRRDVDFTSYGMSIAAARYIMRKVVRIVDEEARKQDLDPLEHQALLQIFGAGDNPWTISRLAERLDVASALTSRLVNSLDMKGLIERRPSATDKRVTMILASQAGLDLLRNINAAVHLELAYFHLGLADEQRIAALPIFAFYLGFSYPENAARILSTMTEEEAG
jgi:DNA-binding MarR family transcriptional regulator